MGVRRIIELKSLFYYSRGTNIFPFIRENQAKEVMTGSVRDMQEFYQNDEERLFSRENRIFFHDDIAESGPAGEGIRMGHLYMNQEEIYMKVENSFSQPEIKKRQESK